MRYASELCIADNESNKVEERNDAMIKSRCKQASG